MPILALFSASSNSSPLSWCKTYAKSMARLILTPWPWKRACNILYLLEVSGLKGVEKPIGCLILPFYSFHLFSLKGFWTLRSSSLISSCSSPWSSSHENLRNILKPRPLTQLDTIGAIHEFSGHVECNRMSSPLKCICTTKSLAISEFDGNARSQNMLKWRHW